jgi:chemotaxis protein methyltransferase CheR
MTHEGASVGFEYFRGVIERRLGLEISDAKRSSVEAVVERRAEQRGLSLEAYLARFEDRTTQEQELRELAPELTVGETYFFRHFDQFRAFVEVVLPARISARAPLRQLRLLSAGCSSGDEAYSLAILLRERGIDASWDTCIRAIDINPVALAKARAGLYSQWSLRETPDDLRRRWFESSGKDLRLHASLRGAVQFHEHSLLQDDAEVWADNSYDVIFCRNALMYLTGENAQRVVARIARTLVPGGYLFLGHAENLRGLSQDFHLQHSHDTFYYQRKSEHEVSTPASLPEVAPVRKPWSATPFPEDPTWSSTWVDIVQRTAERIRALAEKPPEAASTQTEEPPPRAVLAPALELLGHERFSDALETLERLPHAEANDPDALLLRAALLTHSGQLSAAEQACNKLLLLDELSAGAHYLLALCRERQGDLSAATDQDQTASYLDPSFAMPHLHLGLMARRSGDRAGAQRELGQAMLLLQREDASRLILFGGGFGREGLIALCRSELRRLGGSS